MAAGDLTASRAAGNVVGGILGAFSPVGSETSETLSGALLKNAAPTILRPFANLAMNENFMGAQIYQENMPFGTPNRTASWADVQRLRRTRRLHPG